MQRMASKLLTSAHGRLRLGHVTCSLHSVHGAGSCRYYQRLCRAHHSSTPQGSPTWQSVHGGPSSSSVRRIATRPSLPLLVCAPHHPANKLFSTVRVCEQIIRSDRLKQLSSRVSCRASGKGETRANLNQQQVRNCSCRRIMCTGRGLAGDSGNGAAVDITQSREILPDNVKTIHYHLTLEPNLESFEYDGKVAIDLEVVRDSDSISLNTLDLDIYSTELSQGHDKIVCAPDTSYNAETQSTTISLKDGSLKAGQHVTLTMKFTGVLNNNMAGFYRSTYTNKAGETKYMATTQMEPTDARRAFPCFDEPALKSQFTVTLIADKQMTCLSNMDIKEESSIDGKYGNDKKAVTFNKTPLMSTYLLAFVVGELNYIETNEFRVPVRVYAPPDQDINHGRFSLDLAAKTLAFYEQAFDSPFPLPKMDMVSIPDFSAGAMENWGLITYRIVDLLFDEATSSAAKKQRVAEVVQHELAHQWFGNLVTMDFWEGLWLNEGFATWMSWYSCHRFFPDWKVWQTYVVDTLQGALSLDSLRSSHPIEVPVKRADEINQIFDAISYSKGSCVIRMVSKYLGEDVFMRGIQLYLKRHAYGNTQTGDLWAALSEVSGRDVGKVMSIWTKKIGYPVVAVTEDSSNKAIHVKQNRYLRTNDVKPEEDETLYPIFLGLRTRDGLDESLVLSERQASFPLGDLDFYKLNADHSGTYRVCYTPERLSKLGEAAKSGMLTTEDRAGMISDAGALAASGHQATGGLLSLLRGFKDESEFIVWNEMLGRIASLRGAWLFEDQPVRDGLQKLRLDLVTSKAKELGWAFSDSDGNLLQQFKAMMFSSAGQAGDEEVKQAARDMFNKLKAGDDGAIDPNIRSSVYAIVLNHGGKEEYEALLDIYRKAKTADEKNDCLRNFGCSRDTKLVERTLALALSPEVKGQDIYMPLGALRGNAASMRALFEWMKTNWDELVKRLPPGLSMLSSVVSLCTSGFSREEDAKKVEEFFKDKSTKGFDQSLAQSLDTIRAKAHWVERDRESVKQWLKSNGYLQ